MNLPEVLERVKEWAIAVGEIQLQYHRQPGLLVNFKSDVSDLVTEVDGKSEALIVQEIQRHYPTTAILAEESGFTAGTSEYTWVIDPLDGTTNFVQGLPIFCVSIGLKHHDQTVLGVVYAPYLKEMYTAIRGQGAFCNGRRLQVAGKSTYREAVLGTGFPYDKHQHPENNIRQFIEMAPQLRGIRRFGAAAYDLACVAAGHMDGYWEMNLGEWDVSAGGLLVEEAGGVIIPYRRDRRLSIIAGNSAMTSLIRADVGKK